MSKIVFFIANNTIYSNVFEEPLLIPKYCFDFEGNFDYEKSTIYFHKLFNMYPNKKIYVYHINEADRVIEAKHNDFSDNYSGNKILLNINQEEEIGASYETGEAHYIVVKRRKVADRLKEIFDACDNKIIFTDLFEIAHKEMIKRDGNFIFSLFDREFYLFFVFKNKNLYHHEYQVTGVNAYDPYDGENNSEDLIYSLAKLISNIKTYVKDIENYHMVLFELFSENKTLINYENTLKFKEKEIHSGDFTEFLANETNEKPKINYLYREPDEKKKSNYILTALLTLSILLFAISAFIFQRNYNINKTLENDLLKLENRFEETAKEIIGKEENYNEIKDLNEVLALYEEEYKKPDIDVVKNEIKKLKSIGDIVGLNLYDKDFVIIIKTDKNLEKSEINNIVKKIVTDDGILYYINRSFSNGIK